uniref:Uncharacterized protein n=1 Tax=Amphimedon queenslandica TaxID=400682 RepID=A0A1X7UF44_AMPQE
MPSMNETNVRSSQDLDTTLQNLLKEVYVFTTPPHHLSIESTHFSVV